MASPDVVFQKGNRERPNRSSNPPSMFKMNQNYMVLIWYLVIVIVMIYLFIFSQ